MANQVARLESGAVRPEMFDFSALKFDGAGWGAAALAKLSESNDNRDAAAIRARATQALAMLNRYGINQPTRTLPTAEALAERVAVYPAGRTLPTSFYDAGFWPIAGGGLPTCFRTTTAKCVARYLTPRQGAPEAILFLDVGAGYIFEPEAGGQWRKTAQLAGAVTCGPVRQGLEHDEFTLDTHPWPDLVVGDQRVDISPLPQACPPVPAEPLEAAHPSAPDYSATTTLPTTAQ